MRKNLTHVHTVVKLSPQSYLHTESCHQIVVRHAQPVLRTMLTKGEFKDFKKEVRAKYGDAVTLRHGWRLRSRHVTIAYAPDRFKAENTLRELEEALYFLLMRGCARSHTADVIDMTATRC